MSSSEETKKPRKEKKKKTENTVGTIVEVQPETQTEEEKKNTFFDQLPPELKEMKHNFWDHQPVLKISKTQQKLNFSAETSDEFDVIEQKTVDEISKEPYKLPETHEWYEIDVNDDEEMQQIYELLESNYVEDDDAMFRFAYPVTFLRWALTPPKWKRSWHISVRTKSTKKFVAFISAVPAKFCIKKQKKSKELETVEINFLCVHKQLRSKRLAPLLIQEITRRVNVENIWQAVYTAGILIPKPFSVTRYYHRFFFFEFNSKFFEL
jgi:glycylpeptide N-tetradecanoyltransferase